MEEEEKRSLINPFETLLLILGIGVIAYVLYKNDGLNLVEKTEKVEIIDRPKSSSNYESRKPTRPSEKDQQIDQLLARIANQFSTLAQETPSKKTKSNLENLGLSQDEVKFYKKINDTYKFDDKIKNTQDWFTVLKTANSTYSKVKSLFQNSNQIADSSNPSDLTEKGIPQSLSFKMKKTFDLEEEALQKFTQSGGKSISDWAAFVLANQ